MSFPKVQYNNSIAEDTLVTQGPFMAPTPLKLLEKTGLPKHFSPLRQKLQASFRDTVPSLSQMLSHLHFRPLQSLTASVSSDSESGEITDTKLKLRSREEFIEELIADKTKFDAYVYSDVRNVSEILKDRENDSKLRKFVLESLPKELHLLVESDKKTIVLFRHLITPNYEAHRFMTCADVMGEFRPIVFELAEDKFTDVNVLKRALGKLVFYRKLDKNDTPIVQYKSIVDMSKWNGLKISEMKTLTGSSLPDFHRRFFLSKYPEMKNNIYDISNCLGCSGGETAIKWYKNVLSVFLQHGFLFENFLTENKDLEFTKSVFLPAFISIYEETGFKPLIVALEPTKIEGSSFWHSYPHSDLEVVKSLLTDKS